MIATMERTESPISPAADPASTGAAVDPPRPAVCPRCGYDLVGEVTRWTDGKAKRVTFYYDPAKL